MLILYPKMAKNYFLPETIFLCLLAFRYKFRGQTACFEHISVSVFVKENPVDFEISQLFFRSCIIIFTTNCRFVLSVYPEPCRRAGKGMHSTILNARRPKPVEGKHYTPQALNQRRPERLS